ncbi:MAG: TSCPD domain-containing protein, partial [Chloroflexota bacterium]|nr:TSCPD domain-containing protein [Chloroflexota bacterium]
APTGTLSIIANVSSGIEPLFALSYVRHVLDNDALVEVHPIFEEVAKREEFYSPEMMKALSEGKSLQEMDKVPEWAKRLFVTAHDISPEWHVRMQAAFQRYTDNAVSKTVNFPHDATTEDVDRAFRLAYREGCKGITIYRDQSKDQQVLTTGQAVPKEQPVETGKITPRRRPRDTNGKVSKIATGCGSLYVTVARDEQGVCEVFSHLGKAGGCASAQSEACARLISLALRSGVEVEAITDQLQGIRCPSPAWDSGQSVLSCPDAIATVLQRLTAAKEEATHSPVSAHSKGNGHSSSAEGHSPEPPRPSLGKGTRNLAGQCPECSSLLVYQEGCLTCRSCGYTRCS